MRAKGLRPEHAVADLLKKNGLVGATLNGRPAARMKTFVDVYKVDGLFTDNPDLFPR